MVSFRLDRFLTLYLFRLFISDKNLSGNKKIPILMYHSISDGKEESHPYYHVNTSPATFNAHMQYLHDNDYSVINLNDLEKCFNANNQIKHVAITFDDGFRDFHTSAYPILKKYNFSATVFLPTGFIHNERLSFKGKECLTWHEVRQLRDKGIEFGSHTVTHPELISLRNEDLEYEVRQSKETIEDKLNRSVDTFSYPFRFPDENKTFIKNLRNLIQKLGYHHGVSTRIGTTSIKDDTYFMKRIPVNSADDIQLFRAKLEGGYDWLYNLQHIYKKVRSL